MPATLPYLAVIVTSELSLNAQGYEGMASRLAELAAQQPGFLGFDSVRGKGDPSEVHEIYRSSGRGTSRSASAGARGMVS